MSAKTSPSSLRDAASVGPTVQIKKELPSDEIKEFAHNTMNELLGWYGYDVDRTSRLLQSAAAAAVVTQQQQQQQQQQQHQQQLEARKRHSFLRSGRSSSSSLAYHHNNNNKNSNNNNTNNNNNNNSNSSNNNSNNINANTGNGHGRSKSVVNCNSTTTTPSDHDTRSSREDDSKSPNSIGKPATILTTGMATTHIEEKIDFNNCCWCHRPIAENAPDYLTSTDGPRYCSESCFTQSRRATFKKAKTCDWCKHVRHAVSYVDFQDGASQLQFCSEKCLNQYKMQIFCNETQAHLDMNPHLRDQGLDAGNDAGLITPDLWLRNCRSRSASPASTVSVSPGPIKQSSPCVTPPSNPVKPLISVAPVSKLLAQRSPIQQAAGQVPPPPLPQLQQQQQQQRHHNMTSKSGRRKRPHRGTMSSGSETVASLLQKQQQQQQQQQHQQPAPLSADFTGSSVPLPPLSPMPMPEQSHPPPQPAVVPPPPSLGRGPGSIPPSYFATPPNGVLGHPFGGRPPHHFLPPPPGMLPRGFIPPFGPLPFPTPQMPEFGLLGTAPPVTVMVPYPIIIPLPIPIPVPLPVVDFYKAHLTPEERKRFDEDRARKDEQTIEPLDCSRTRTEIDQTDDEFQPDVLQEEVEEETKMEQQELQKQQQQQQKEQQQQQQPEEDPVEEPHQHDNEEDEEELEKPIPKTSPSIATPSPSSSSPVGSDVTSPETHCIVRATSQTENDGDTLSTAQKLPKLKITRLQTKRTLIQTKESSTPPATAASTPVAASAATTSTSECSAECSRPLRKRKRIIDCDFQKIALAREVESVDHNSSSNSGSHGKDDDEVCNITNNNSNSSSNININSSSSGSGSSNAKIKK